MNIDIFCSSFTLILLSACSCWMYSGSFEQGVLCTRNNEYHCIMSLIAILTALS